MTSKTGVGRGAAKAILLGEHAVVHGKRALAMSLPCGVTARAEEAGHPFQLSAPAWGLSVSAGDGAESEKAALALAATMNLDLHGIKLTLDTEIPPRSGLGASAAVAAATARSISALRGVAVSEECLFEAVQSWEKVFHGNPSGIDAAAALGKGVIVFSRAEGAKALDVSGPRVLVVHSGRPKDTRNAVDRFSEKISRHPDEARGRLGEMEALVNRGIDALSREDLAAFGGIMVENHAILKWFGVSSEELDEIVEIAMHEGALGAKLTGGGMGGCAIVLAGEAEKRVKEKLALTGYSIVPT